MKIFLDERVVAVPPVHALRRAQIVIALQLDSRDVLGDVHELIDRYGFARAQVDRLQDFGVHDPLNAFRAVVDEHEAARLDSAAPNFNFVLAGNLGFDHFPADGRRRFFAPAEPCPPRAIDIVKARHARRKTEILHEVTAHSFRK